MKVRVSTLCYFNLILLMIVNLGLHNLIGLELDTRYIRIATATCGLVWTFVLLRYNSFRLTIAKEKFLFRLCCIILIIVAIELCYTVWYYGQGLMLTYYELCPLIMSIWCLPITVMLKCNIIKFDSLLELIASLTIISYILRFATHLCKMVTGSYIMEGIVFEYGEPGIRNGFYRIQNPCLGIIFIPVAAYLFLHSTRGTKKCWYLIGIVLSISYTAIINQSRSVLIYQTIILIGMFFLKERRSKAQIITWFVGMVCLLILSQSSVMDYVLNLIASFNPNSEFGQSTTIRISTIVYYMSLLREKFLLGIGAISAGTSQGLYLLRGNAGTAYLDDIGFLATIVRYGVLGICLYLTLFTYSINVLIVVKRNKATSQYALLLGGLLFSVLLWGINIDCFFYVFSFGMPFFLAIFEYCRYMAYENEILNSKMKYEREIKT